MKMSERYKQAVQNLPKCNTPFMVEHRKELVAKWVKWRLVEMSETLANEICPNPQS